MRKDLACLLSFAVLSACGGPSAYEDESFSASSPYQARFAADVATTCEAARRTLLSQGYTVVSALPDALRATKNFQPEEESHLQIEFNISCVESGSETVAYANAVQTAFGLKQSSSSAGFSVSGVGSLSLPWSSRNDSLVKVGGETISDPEFYSRFFKRMGDHAPRVKRKER